MTILTIELDNLLVPVKTKARIHALDLIRGMSILGILAVNADGFASPTSGSLNPVFWVFPSTGWTAISYWIMDTFFHDKFVTLFSMLFGVSLFLVGGELSDRQKGKILARRLVVLLLFAMLHGFGIWWGDILSLYAGTGFIMFFCRSWRPRTLMIAGILSYAFMQCSLLPPAALPFASPEARAQAVARMVPDNAAVARRKVKIAADMTAAKASWAGAYRVNAREYVNVMSGYPWIMPSTLALMMIGLALFKSGFLAGRSSTRRYAATIAIGATALGVVAWLSWRKNIGGMPVLGENVFESLFAPFISLSYASALILLLRAGAASVLSPLAAAGRMAFTNYLSQSLIMTSIFYGGRGGLMGEIDRPGLWAIVLAVWALQLIWSPLWLSRFDMGPFEWAWRCLTYGRRIPLLTTQERA